MYREKWIIEARTADGKLDLSGQQPHNVFGIGAIIGMDEDAIAKVIFARIPDACLTGDKIGSWPSMIDPRWIARRKTW